MPVVLPPDVFESILNHVENPSDVLNVALSNKVLCSIAIPQHLHYRDIRSRLSNIALWTWLSRLDDLRAARIRSLTILPDQDWDFYSLIHTYDLRERLPPDFIPSQGIPLSAKRDLDLYRQCEVILISVLERMSSLQRFRWYRVPRPMVNGGDDIWSILRRGGTIKEIDLYDGEAEELTDLPIATLDTFLGLSSLTTFELRSSICKLFDEPEMPAGLEKMLLRNLPDIEILVIELDIDEQFDGTANIDNLLNSACWPKLRVLRLRGVNCGVSSLIRFLAFHCTIEHLCLAQMMPGHAWTRLALELPTDALPHIRHLKCSSAQAAALLKVSRPNLRTLLGIELHETIVDRDHFTWDNEWELEEDHEDYDETIERPSPWRNILLDNLRGQPSITRLGVSVNSTQEIAAISVVAPQLVEIDIGPTPRGIEISNNDWYNVLAFFPRLEVLCGGNFIWFHPYRQMDSSEVESANVQIQALAKACPRLRAILVGVRAKKAIIIREKSIARVRWVVREWKENEDAVVNTGEPVYGP